MIYKIKSMKSFSILFLSLIIIANFSYSKSNDTGIRTIVIDPGHGGKDPGAVVGNAREKAIVLDIGLRLGAHIKRSLPDIKIVYTRDRDFFVPLFERAQIANKNNADLFISIHANYCGSSTVKGTETYVLGLHRTQDNLDVAKKENSVILLEDDYTTRYEGFDPSLSESYIMFELIQDNYIEQSVTFAGIIQDQFRIQAQRADRDVRQAGFLVLRETSMPSVLVEAGYLSNKSENSYLLTESGREEIAYSLFKSVYFYKNKFESRLSKVSPLDKTENTDKKPEQIPVPEMANNDVNEIKQPIPEKAVVEVPKEAPKNEPFKSQEQTTTFAIQLASSVVQIPLNSKTFKGIQEIKELPVRGTYKYLCFEFADLTETKKHLSEVRAKIPDAFIVAVRNGATMSVIDALKKN
jgi:N-acetylmuramoyl-L-alanine amidase